MHIVNSSTDSIEMVVAIVWHIIIIQDIQSVYVYGIGPMVVNMCMEFVKR